MFWLCTTQTWYNNWDSLLYRQGGVPVGTYKHTVPFQNVSSSLHHLHVVEVRVKPDQHCLDIWITLPLQPLLQTTLQWVRLGRRGRRKGREEDGGGGGEERRGGGGEEGKGETVSYTYHCKTLVAFCYSL